MDDFKRGIYLEVRRELELHGGYICVKLEQALGRQVMRIYAFDGQNPLFELCPELLVELFPEFFALWDGYSWLFGKAQQRNDALPTGEDVGWWDLGAAGEAARLATLDFLLTRGT